MKEIGGYFGLELNDMEEYYPNLIKLNTGRNCLEYILRVRTYNKIFIPYYTCEVILEPIDKLKIEYEYYLIDMNFNIVFDKHLAEDESILINNYFGINSKNVINTIKKYRNVIVDNCQAFFEKPIDGIDTFYSARKFFGVSDGAYLSIDKKLVKNLKTDKSYNRMEHLLKRIDKSANFGYENFKKNDDDLINNSIKKMSELTQKILKSIDYDNIKSIREKNFLFLHSYLKEFNELKINVNSLNGPIVYPFLYKKCGLRELLIKNKVYVATYWPNVFEWVNESSAEYYLTKYLLPLPIDQRYTLDDMKLIIDYIMKFTN